MMVSKAELRRFQMQLNTVALSKLEAVREMCKQVEHYDLDAKKLREDIDAEIQRRKPTLKTQFELDQLNTKAKMEQIDKLLTWGE